MGFPGPAPDGCCKPSALSVDPSLSPCPEHPAAHHQPSPAPDFCRLAKASGAAPRIDFSRRALRQILSHPAVHHTLPLKSGLQSQQRVCFPWQGPHCVLGRQQQARPWYCHSTVRLLLFSLNSINTSRWEPHAGTEKSLTALFLGVSLKWKKEGFSGV